MAGAGDGSGRGAGEPGGVARGGPDAEHRAGEFPDRLAVAGDRRPDAPIACCQFEYHVLLRQPALLAFLRAHDLPIVAYSPLAKGALVDVPVLVEIGRKHGASASQIGLAWLLEQPDVAAIPKSARPERMRENLAALALRLDDEDRARIAALPKDRRIANPPFHPVWDAAG